MTRERAQEIQTAARARSAERARWREAMKGWSRPRAWTTPLDRLTAGSIDLDAQWAARAAICTAARDDPYCAPRWRAGSNAWKEEASDCPECGAYGGDITAVVLGAGTAFYCPACRVELTKGDYDFNVLADCLRFRADRDAGLLDPIFYDDALLEEYQERKDLAWRDYFEAWHAKQAPPPELCASYEPATLPTEPEPIPKRSVLPPLATVRKIQRAIMDQSSRLRCRGAVMCLGRSCECYRQAREAARIAVQELRG